MRLAVSRRGVRSIPAAWKNIVTDYGATPGGSGTTTGDYTAFKAFHDFAMEQAGWVGLILPPTPNSYYGTSGSYTHGRPFFGIPKLIVMGYGASMNNLHGTGVLQDSAKRSAIHTVAAGSDTVELIDAERADIYAVGNMVLLAGIDLQAGWGYPPNSHFNEWHRIAEIDGAFIRFEKPIKYSYNENWPRFFEGNQFELGGFGSATISLAHPGWDCEHRIYGVRHQVDPGGQTYYYVRKSRLFDVKQDQLGFIIGASEDMRLVNQQHTLSHMEVDKLSTRALIGEYGPASKNINVQSSSVDELIIRGGSRIIAGTARHTYIIGGNRPEIRLGPTSYGIADYIEIRDAVVTIDITSIGMSVALDDDLTYEGDGVFRWTREDAPQWLIPGAVGYIGTESPYFLHSFFRVIDTISETGEPFGPILIQTTLEGEELPAVEGYTNTGLVRHGAPNLTVINCSGCPAAEELSLLPPNSSFGTIKRRTYTTNGNKSVGMIVGRLVHYKINVTQPYTGVASALNLKIGGTSHMWLIDADGDPLQVFDARVNLKVAGERIITPEGVVGAQSGDNNLTALTGGVWMPSTSGHSIFIGNNGAPVDITGENASVRPIVTVEILTDQEIPTAA